MNLTEKDLNSSVDTEFDECYKLNTLIKDYYENYYKTQLGLPDWQTRLELRLNEEENYCQRFIEWIEEWLDYDFSGKKVLVVGCGTGGELVNFHKRGAEVFGIEPNADALKISLEKAKLNLLSNENIIRGFAEVIPFEDEVFDFIYCSTVLEHVKDVKKSISEMIRCTRIHGRIFIETPDYRQWYEPHYKLYLPMFMPNILNKIILKLLGRPTKFLSSIQKLNSRILTNIFMEYPVIIFRVLHSWPSEWKQPVNIKVKLMKFIIQNFEIQRDQFWILKKLERPR